MTSTVTQWHEYIEQEKIMWLIEHALPPTDKVVPDDFKLPAYDMVLIGQCEQRLNADQRSLYIQYMSSAIAAITYEGMSDAETQTQATGDKFYWNYLTAPVDLRARCIWNVLADFAP